MMFGEFGNLIAGDPRSSPAVQLRLLHSKYHLCSVATRALLLSTYVKFVNLFPEIKTHVQEIFLADSNLRSSDAELQQRASEYLALSKITSLDVLATVLEEMPPFPEKESSGLLNLLKKKRPGRVPENPGSLDGHKAEKVNGAHGAQSGISLPDANEQEGGSADLLGLGAPSLDNGHEQLNGNAFGPPVNNINKFYCKSNGVLYENDIVQIGVKTECKSNLARLAIFYGNKTNFPFLNFQPAVSCNTELSEAIILQVKQVDSTVEAGAQFQQMVNVECVSDFNEQPDLHLSFYYNGVMQNVDIKLPITVNKFIEPTEMNGEAFFSRWKNLSMPAQESQKIFKAEFPMENVEATKTKLIGYGFQLLEGIDPNPDNFVCAGIIHTRAVQIGVLLRLEPNKQAEMYRLTTRSSKESVSQYISGVLCEQF